MQVKRTFIFTSEAPLTLCKGNASRAKCKINVRETNIIFIYRTLFNLFKVTVCMTDCKVDIAVWYIYLLVQLSLNWLLVIVKSKRVSFVL